METVTLNKETYDFLNKEIAELKDLNVELQEGLKTNGYLKESYNFSRKNSFSVISKDDVVIRLTSRYTESVKESNENYLRFKEVDNMSIWEFIKYKLKR